jgi:hypothetical protein
VQLPCGLHLVAPHGWGNLVGVCVGTPTSPVLPLKGAGRGLHRLVEESDFELAQEAFGGAAALDLDKFIPKSQGEFEMYAKVVASKLLKPYERSAHYMNMMKALLRATTSFMDASEAKELETAMGVIRNEKVKAEKPVAKSKKGESPAVPSPCRASCVLWSWGLAG